MLLCYCVTCRYVYAVASSGTVDKVGWEVAGSTTINFWTHSQTLAASSKLNAPRFWAMFKKETMTLSATFSLVIATSTKRTCCSAGAEEEDESCALSIIDIYLEYLAVFMWFFRLLTYVNNNGRCFSPAAVGNIHLASGPHRIHRHTCLMRDASYYDSNSDWPRQNRY